MLSLDALTTLKFSQSEQFNLLNDDIAIIDDDLMLECFPEQTKCISITNDRNKIVSIVSDDRLETTPTSHAVSTASSFTQQSSSTQQNSVWFDFVSRPCASRPSEPTTSTKSNVENVSSWMLRQQSLPQSIEEMLRTTAKNASDFAKRSTAISTPNFQSAILPAATMTNEDNNVWKHGAFFPQQMYDALQDPEMKQIVRWSPNGQSFVILDKDQFVEKVLEKYFPTNKSYHSFTRRLNRWGFFKNTAMFSHPSFQRDRPNLLKQIRPRPNVSKNRRSKKTRHVTI